MIRSVLSAALLLFFTAVSTAAEIESFDTDPGWEGFRNRLVGDHPPVTKQHFGFSPDTNRAKGAKPGEIGGRVQRSTTPAWLARSIEPRTLNDRLTVSGRFSVTRDDGGTGTCFGWFNTESRGWRTPNSLAFRIDGNGDKYWVFFEYGTREWRSGCNGCFEGQAYQKTKTKPFAADGTPHDWTLTYDPLGAAGRGEITFVLDGKSYVLALDPGHKEDGAAFDRFGIFNQQTTGGSSDVWFDDVIIDGKTEDFSKWQGKGNEIEYPDRVRRPNHDFGFSPTHHAGGKSAGEIGGIIWRDENPAYYAQKIRPLDLNHEFGASGKLVFRGAGSDSAVWLGWFDSKTKRGKESAEHEVPQPNILALIIEGPSRIGHYIRPGFRDSQGEGKTSETGPIIRPDGKPHDWSIRYHPKADGGNGVIIATFDGKEQKLEVDAKRIKAGATFDRFGFFNAQSGGNYVEVFIVDLRYDAGE